MLRLDWPHRKLCFVPLFRSCHRFVSFVQRSCALMRIRSAAIAALSLFSIFFCAGAAARAQTIPPAVKAAEASIDGENIRAHVKFLSDDLLGGRGPGLRGSELAAKTKFALVPQKGKAIDLTYGDDYTVSNRKLTPMVNIDVPIVFVGFGVTAPEFQWDDYAGIDVKGKVILCIVGDPPSDDPNFFGGKALTYYGRWTYKFEQAARMGAVGALIIHRTDLASYGWDVVKNSNTSEKTYLRDDKNPQLEAASWIQLDVAKRLFAASGMDIDAEMAAAGKRGFKAVELPVRLKAHVESTVRPFQSANVIGILPGTNAGGKYQAVMYTAHYDHLGFVPGMAGDNIYNGAADNGTGCGMILELARAWTQSGIKPPHSVIFASVTAEEQGLLGSEYLGQHPPIPVSQIALDINYDMILPIGVPLETNVNGAQRTSFFPTVEATAKRFDLAIVPDPRPEAGSYYRSDHFSLSRVGIPAFSIETGVLYEGHDAAWGRKQHEDFNAHDYHNFSDNYHADWDFRGNAKLDRCGMELGWEALTAPTTIQWNANDEFEAARKAASN